MAGTAFGYATDNDSNLDYRRKVGSGAFSTVHEVLQPANDSDVDLHRYTIFVPKGWQSMLFIKFNASLSQGNCFTFPHSTNTLSKRR